MTRTCPRAQATVQSMDNAGIDVMVFPTWSNPALLVGDYGSPDGGPNPALAVLPASGLDPASRGSRGRCSRARLPGCQSCQLLQLAGRHRHASHSMQL